MATAVRYSSEASVRKKLLVTGCARSGTQFSAVLFDQLGLGIGHEKMGRDGIASWCMAVDAEWVPWGEVRTRFCFEHVFHQVRHPLAVIRSSLTLKPRSWQFICAHTPCDPGDPVIVRAAKYWLYWNLHAEEIATVTFRIESIRSELERLCDGLGIRADLRVLRDIPTNLNTRRFGRALHVYDELGRRLPFHAPRLIRGWLIRESRGDRLGRLTWEELSRDAPQWHSAIREKALAYGYDD
jgi:hypothetical protein